MGVKSLWSLLSPVGRPIMLETVEGKVMAIDSSIWIYQFQATMRDKDGRALLNAHVLGFLRRISKLLFYGIKPVFVFDGGAPVLKRTTLRGRREKKSGAAANHARLAEKLLAAQMRKEALSQAYGSNHQKAPVSKGRPALDDSNTVYLEDIDPSMSRTPARKKLLDPSAKFYDHDPYRLPDIDMEEAVAKAAQSTVPDPRLATEDELRTFIEDMRPEDFDITSPAFRELPTEVQYEIVGDLRLKSRQTSYARLQKMLQSTRTPLDFSKQQIQNLKQRNNLTQQLLITTDSIGSAHISIPVRIASERNKEYVLIKNEGESGGWILGIRDDGTKQKPIEIDQEEVREIDENSDEDMEEISIPVASGPDPDLREYQQQMALSAIGNRSNKQPLPVARTQTTKLKPTPVPEVNTDEIIGESLFDNSSDDDELAFAIQASLDQTHDKTPHYDQRLQLGLSPTKNINTYINDPSTSKLTTPPPSSKDDTYFSPTPLETVLSIANTGPSRIQALPSLEETASMSFGRPIILTSRKQSFSTPDSKHSPDINTSTPAPPLPVAKLPEIRPSEHISPSTTSPLQHNFEDQDSIQHTPPTSRITLNSSTAYEKVHVGSKNDAQETASSISTNLDNLRISTGSSVTGLGAMVAHPEELEMPLQAGLPYQSSLEAKQDIPTSQVSSPVSTPSSIASPTLLPLDEEHLDDFEAVDLVAEEDEFAHFISEVKGKDIEDVRREIDDEIQFLNQQRKAAIRDSEDITQQMISQIMTMLRLFGIPYITAPMEAEAQCAELVSLGLVDGVITDDSDVFLFGAQRVFRNMFNQSKTVECFLLSDLSRELGLERDTLVRLAYLLGSDYVDGLPGVGPVVAMELLKEFPGEDGLHKFKDWWLKVQTGKDKDEDNNSKFRKQFKKKFKDLYLPAEWPNPEVRDAYYHPIVDSSDEPFKWGFPDLDALRGFFRDELGWGQAKVDEILLPVIQRMNKRGQVAALNKQSNLNEFFDITGGSGTYVPRKRQAYASKRLQQVVNDFRAKRKQRSTSPASSLRSRSESKEREESAPAKKRKKKADKAGDEGQVRAGTSKAKRMPRRGGHNNSSRMKKSRDISSDDASQEGDEHQTVNIPPDPMIVARLRPRPKTKPTYRGAQNALDEDPN